MEAGETTPASPAWADELAAYAGGLMERHSVPGMAVAVSAAGETVYEAGFGFRDVEQGLPATSDTVFGIGSVSKSFTALAVMQLQDAGVLSVADAVVKWLPAFCLPGAAGARRAAEVTLHHLLTHSSGLPPEPALFHARAGSVRLDPDLPWMEVPQYQRDLLARVEPISTYDDLLALMASQDFAPLGPPGRYFSYSNEGYALLAAIVERASDRPFPAYLQENIVAPLGLACTGCRTPDFPLRPPVAQIYSRGTREGQKGVYAAPHWWSIADIYGNGNMVSTARDLLRYLQVYVGGGAIDGRRIVSAEAIAQMCTPHVPIPTGGFYGYGLAVHPEYHGVTLIGHSGGNKGIAADVAFVPSRGLAAAGVSNLAGGPTARVNRGALNLALGLPVDTRPDDFPEHALSPDEMARLVGMYRGEDGSSVAVTLDAGALHVQDDLDEQPRASRSYAADAIVIDPDAALRFLLDEAGEVWALSSGLRIRRKVRA